MAEVEFALLGPLLVRSSGIILTIQAGKQRALLAGLLLQRGCVVSVAELIETLWGKTLQHRRGRLCRITSSGCARR